MGQRVAFFDVAGTIVRGNPWTYVLRHPSMNRLRVNAAYVPAMSYWAIKKAGLRSDTWFRDRWLRVMASLLAGQSHADLEGLFSAGVAHDAEAGQFHQSVLARIREHKAHGDRVVLVSGIFEPFVQQYAAHVGADASIGSKLHFNGQICTGNVEGETCNGPRKLEFIRAWLREQRLADDLSQHLAYADSYSDVPMLEAVGQAVAVSPENALRTVAQVRGWSILDEAE